MVRNAIRFSSLWIYEIFLLAVILVFFTREVSGQKADSLLVVPTEESVEWAAWPVPQKALLFAIIPGGGQLYNKKWWKLPFVYASLGAGGYWVYKNQKAYRYYRDELLREIAEPGSTGRSRITLKNYRDQRDKSTQQAYLYFGVIYILQGVEAFVDAHLAHFDVSDDLSWELRPGVQPVSVSAMPVAGLTLSIPLTKKVKHRVPNGRLLK